MITPDQMARNVLKSMKKHGLFKILKDAKPKEKRILIKAIANMFGAKIP